MVMPSVPVYGLRLPCCALDVEEQDPAVGAECRAGELGVVEPVDCELEDLALAAVADQPVDVLDAGRERVRVAVAEASSSQSTRPRAA